MRSVYLALTLWLFSPGLNAQTIDSTTSDRSFILRFNSLSEKIQVQLDSIMGIMDKQPDLQLDMQRWFRNQNSGVADELRPILGVVFEGVSEDDIEKLAGVRVIQIIEGSSAALAGLQPGDRITKLDGIPIRTADDIISILNNKKSGDEIRITYIRNDNTEEVLAILQNKQEDNIYGSVFEQKLFPTYSGNNSELYGFAQKLKPRLGIKITDLDDEFRKTLKLKKNSSGTLINQIEKESPAQIMGLKVYDLIIAFNNKKVNNSNDLIDFMQSAKFGDAVSITYIRNGKKNTSTIELSAFDTGWNPWDQFRIFRLEDNLYSKKQIQLQQELEELREKIRSLEEELKMKGN